VALISKFEAHQESQGEITELTNKINQLENEIHTKDEIVSQLEFNLKTLSYENETKI